MAASGSRYKRSTLIRLDDGRETYARMGEFAFLDPKKVGARFVRRTVLPEHVHRPDIIASQYYGSPTYAWVVIMYNGGRAFGWPELGEEIMLPTPDIVISEL